MTEAGTNQAQGADFRRIVVGVDGSDGADRALDWAAVQAGHTDSVLEIIAAYGADYAFITTDEVRQTMARVTQAAADHLREVAPGVVTKQVPSDGSPVAALVEVSRDADLLVVGSRGLGGFEGLVLGSVGHKCALHAHCPVVVVRPSGTAGPSFGRLVVGVDGSASSTRALEWSFAEAERFGATVVAVTCWTWPNSFAWGMPVPAQFSMADDAETVLDEALEPLRALHPGVRVERSVVQGHPSPSLVAMSKKAGLLVVGSRGHGEFVSALLGSVSEYCVSHAHCPVLIIRE